MGTDNPKNAYIVGVGGKVKSYIFGKIIFFSYFYTKVSLMPEYKEGLTEFFFNH